MKFKFNQKFEIVEANLQCEVLGCFPSKQTVMIDGASYRLLVNGVEMTISEKNLEHFIQSGKKPVAVEEEVKPLDKAIDEIVEKAVDEVFADGKSKTSKFNIFNKKK